MVKKLLKHELVYYLRTLGVFLPIVVVIGIVARVFELFDNGHWINEIIIGSSNAMLVVSCAVLLILSTVVCVVRFYKNMYASEGYLTFTLPITNAQHIFAKLLIAMVCQAACLLTVVVAWLIALSGEGLLEAFRMIALFIEKLSQMCGVGNLIAFALEFVVIMILSGASTILLYYACITVGQTAKKNRILMAVGAYFIYYIATQILTTIFTIIITLLGATTDALIAIVEWIEMHAIAATHLFLCLDILFGAAMAGVFWYVTQTIMTEKLNLE